MIQAKFGLVDIALRTLEVYTTATVEATVAPQAPPPKEWRTCMDKLAAEARKTYRSIVYDDPRFIPYFQTATPEPELGAMNIGSRPPRRAKGGGVESLRAIPWQFAWTQTRLLLASWLGVEDALSDEKNPMQREMYAQWAFFTSTIDLMEMTLAKADGRIAAQYDRLVPDELRAIGLDLRARLNRAVHAVLSTTRHAELLENPAHVVVADDDPRSTRGEAARFDRPDLGKDLDGGRKAERLGLARWSDVQVGSRDDRELGLVERIREALANQSIRHLAADLFGEVALEHRARDSTAPEALDLRLLRDALIRALVLAAHPVRRNLDLDPPLHRADLFDLNLHSLSATRARRGRDANRPRG